MADIIQIWKSVERIEKPIYKLEPKHSVYKWGNSIISKTGYLQSDTLFLPQNSKKEPNLKKADLLIIQDIKGFDPFLIKSFWDKTNLPSWFKNDRKSQSISANPQLLYFNSPKKLWPFEIFKIEKSNSDTFDIHLNYSANDYQIGIPKRDDHKIAELKLNNPIRYRVNGKSDFTMSGRKQRTFVEFDYIFEYLGQADNVEFKDLNKIEKVKQIPSDRCKQVDERKVLH